MFILHVEKVRESSNLVRNRNGIRAQIQILILSPCLGGLGKLPEQSLNPKKHGRFVLHIQCGILCSCGIFDFSNTQNQREIIAAERYLFSMGPTVVTFHTTTAKEHYGGAVLVIGGHSEHSHPLLLLRQC